MQTKPTKRVAGEGRGITFAWDELRLFLAVARAGTLGDAARELGCDTSTVSRRLAAFERVLGVALVRRGRGESRLTTAGMELVERASEVERAVHDVGVWAAGRDTIEGVVRVTAPDEIVTHLLAPAMPALRSASPRLRVELIADPRPLDLVRGEADIAIRMSRPRSAQVVARRIATLRYSNWCSEGYRRAHSKPPHDWLALDSSPVLPETRWAEAALSGRLPALRATSHAALASAAAAGLGVAILPDLFAARIPGLRRLDPSAAPVGERTVWVLVPRELRQQPRIRAVLRWIDDAARAATAGVGSER